MNLLPLGWPGTALNVNLYFLSHFHSQSHFSRVCFDKFGLYFFLSNCIPRCTLPRGSPTDEPLGVGVCDGIIREKIYFSVLHS